MPRKEISWFWKCLGFCFLGIFVLNVIGRTVTPLLSWCLYHTNPTPHARNVFAMHYYLLLTALYGFLLGLIPPNRIREVFNSLFANFASKPLLTSPKNDDFTQPIIWAWLPIGTLFLLRFVTWRSPHPSVIAAASEGRFEHFFFPPDTVLLNLFVHTTQLWIFDRYVLTGPTLFLLSYPLGVWFRHQFPSLPDADPTAI